MIARPVLVEPVKEIISTRGSLTSCTPIVCGSEEGTILMTPAGMSVECAALPIKVAAHGVSGAGFKTTEHPADKAGIIFAKLICNGTFQGVMQPTTPMASFSIRRSDSTSPKHAKP